MLLVDSISKDLVTNDNDLEKLLLSYPRKERYKILMDTFNLSEIRSLIKKGGEIAEVLCDFEESDRVKFIRIFGIKNLCNLIHTPTPFNKIVDSLPIEDRESFVCFPEVRKKLTNLFLSLYEYSIPDVIEFVDSQKENPPLFKAYLQSCLQAYIINEEKALRQAKLFNQAVVANIDAAKLLGKVLAGQEGLGSLVQFEDQFAKGTLADIYQRFKELQKVALPLNFNRTLRAKL